MNRYRVEWREKTTGDEGHGVWLDHKEAAEATVELMKGLYPDIDYWTASEFPEGPPPLRLTFTIDRPGESAAGISSFTDTVTVEVESGDPGGEEGEFAEFMLTALKEWFNGAKVTTAKEGGK